MAADFIVLPRDSTSSHLTIRSTNIDLNTTDKTNYFDFLKAKPPTPQIRWYTEDDWGLRLLGDGVNNGCNHYLVLGRPGSDYGKLVDLKMSFEIDLDTPVEYLKSHDDVTSVFFGSVFMTKSNGALSTSDILANCSWMARSKGRIVECGDPKKAYVADEFEVIEYLTLTEFGKNGCYLITVNPTLINFSHTVDGICSKTGSRFATLGQFETLQRHFVRHPAFSSNCQELPNDFNPSHVIVDGNSFTVDLFDTLKEAFGFKSGPDMSVISNIPHVRNGNLLTFDMTNTPFGVIDFKFELGASSLLQTTNPNFFADFVVTIIRK